MKHKIATLLLIVYTAIALLFYVEFKKLDYFLLSLLASVVFYLGYLVWNNRYEKNTAPNARSWTTIFLNVFCGIVIYEVILDLVYIFVGTDNLFNLFGISIKSIFAFLCFIVSLIFEVKRVTKSKEFQKPLDKNN